MKRDQLVAGLESIKNKIKELKKKRFKYFIRGKYIPTHGQIELIESPDKLMLAFAFVKKQFVETEIEEDSLASELGFTSVKLKDKDEEQLYFGYTLEEWTEEFKMKASEIQNNYQIEELEKAKEKFKGYRTEDDRFAEDVNKFSGLFVDLGISTGQEPDQSWEDVANEDDSPKLLD